MFAHVGSLERIYREGGSSSIAHGLRSERRYNIVLYIRLSIKYVLFIPLLIQYFVHILVDNNYKKFEIFNFYFKWKDVD